MEQHSQTEPIDANSILEAQIRECFGRVVYSHKTHEKCTDILLSRLSKIKLWQIILSAITTGGFIAIVFGAGKIGSIIGVLTSTTLLVLNTYTKSYDLGELAQKHKQVANDLWLIREKYLSLLTDLAIGNRQIEELKEARDRLLDDLHGIYSGAPSTTFQAYKKARDTLKKYEDMTFTDEEIDALLPQKLRKR